MAYKIPMPDLGTTVDQITLNRWLKNPGDPVKRGEPLAEVETDKAVMEIESIAEGVLLQQEFAPGDLVAQGQVIAVVGEPGEKIESSGGDLKASTAQVRQTADKAKPKEKKKPVERAPQWTAAPREVEPQTSLTELKKDKTFLLDLYRRMVLIRHFEDRVKYLFLEGIMPGTIHQCQGQESSAVGVCAALRAGDIITSTHRPHGHCIARGLDVEATMHELFGKATGCCKGKGGSMHMGDLDAGVLPAIAIVGGNIPVATGMAMAYKMRGEPRVAVCFMGDGATNEGTFHEALNMASLWDLPVVYVVENNKYAASTAVELTMKVKKISDRASAYAMPGITIDGNDVLTVFETAREAIERARSGGGPTLLEVETYRLTGHSRRDPCHYQPEEERKQMSERDPIPRFEAWLTKQKIADVETLKQIGTDVDDQIEQAVNSALAAADPDPAETITDVFA